MQPSLGEIIAHLRRQRHLTQRQLAGERFSKSYVSAVEHNRITPSPDALHFLAGRLGLSNDDIAALQAVAEPANGLPVPLPLSLIPQPEPHLPQDGVLTLLETLLRESDFTLLAPSSDLPLLAAEDLASFPSHLQARYSFLLGLQARAHGDLPAAFHAFQTALALAPTAQQATVLDALGGLCLEMKRPVSALGYSLHALDVLTHSPAQMRPALKLSLTLHCGDTLRQMGSYGAALQAYEQARTLLKAEHELATAAHVYEGLGYCTYAALFPDITFASSPILSFPAGMTRSQEEIESSFERSIGLLLQGCNLAQIAGEPLRQMVLQRMLASVQYGRGVWLRRSLDKRASSGEKEAVRNRCLVSLQEAAEHCRQVLLGWQDPLDHAEITPSVESSIYRALALLIRIPLQRAILARQQGQNFDVAYRNHAQAVFLCQQVMETLAMDSLPWTVIQQALHLSADTLDYHSFSLPRFSEPLESFPHGALSMSEVYFAAAEVAEELGRTSPTVGYERDCYLQANQYLQAALCLTLRGLQQEGRDPALLAHLCLRCAAILEERAMASPTLYEETSKALLRVLTFAYARLPFVSQQAELHELAPERPG